MGRVVDLLSEILLWPLNCLYAMQNEARYPRFYFSDLRFARTMYVYAQPHGGSVLCYPRKSRRRETQGIVERKDSDVPIVYLVISSPK